MFHTKRNGARKMIYVYDFCNACSDGETVKLSFFDTYTNDFISTVILNNAKTGCKTLSAICGYGYVEYFYISADMICVKALVRRDDL